MNQIKVHPPPCVHSIIASQNPEESYLIVSLWYTMVPGVELWSFRLPYNTEESTPPLDNTHPYMNTPVDILFVSFFDHHFITLGTLNTTSPTGNALKKYQTPKLSRRLVDTIHPQRAPVWTPAWRQQLCPITVTRTSLQPQPHRCLLLLVAIYNGMVHET